MVDASGAPVTGLKPDDFTLTDDRVPQKLASFREVKGSAGLAPVHIILLLDAVNNSRSDVAHEIKEIDKYLALQQGHIRFPTSLAILSSSGITVGQGSQEKGALLEESRTLFEGIHTDSCNTRDDIDPFPTNSGLGGASIGMSVEKTNKADCLNKRFATAVMQLRELAVEQEDTLGRVLLVWIGPGWPHLSGPEFQRDTPATRENFFDYIVELSRVLREAQVTVDAVYSPEMLRNTGDDNTRDEDVVEGVPTEEQASARALALQAIARQSGGRVLAGKNIADSIAECVADARSYYALSFDSVPSSQPDEYHVLDVQVNKPGVKVFTTSSYYGEP